HRRSIHEPEPPVERDRVDRPRLFARSGIEPHFTPVRTPGQPLLAYPLARQNLSVAGPIHYRDDAAIVAGDGMIEKGDAIAARRQPWTADVSGGFVQHRTDRKLEPLALPRCAHDHERRSIGRHIG